MNNSTKRQGGIFRERGGRLRACLFAAALCLVWPASSAAQNGVPPPPAVPAEADSEAVFYEADRVEDEVRTGRVVLTGNVVLRHREVELRAGRVVFDRKARRLEAESLPDSTGEGRVGVPVFTRSGERFSGTRMVYDLDTGRGSVQGGRAVHRRKYYRGEDILLNRQGDLYARNLSLSTCDRDHVHYDFLCRDLKVLEDDKAIGRSVTFRIGPVPVFWLPFFVFPIKAGRHSGVLTPNIGSNSRDGIFVGNLGYYYAPNDYWDATWRATVRERGGFLVESLFAYAVRNRLSGDVDLAFENAASASGASSRRWRLDFQHQQRLNPTLNIRGSGQFSSSSDFDRRNSADLYGYLNRQLRSSFSLDKRWPESNRSLDASVTYYRDLEDDRNSFRGFPRLAFRQGRRPLTGRSERSPGAELSWHRSIYYSFSGELTNDFTRSPDANTEDLALQGRLAVNSQHRPFGWLDLSPNLSIVQSLSRNDQDRPTRRESYTGSVSSGTSLYGIFRPHIGRLRGIRHRLQPRVDFRYSQSAQVEGGTFGFGGRRSWGDARKSLGLNLGNAIEIKTEVDGRERRSTFATVNFSSGYEFDRETNRWQPLRTSASIKPDRRIDVRMSMSHSFYDDLGRLSLLSPRLRGFSVTSSLRFRGRAGGDDPDLETGPDFRAGGADFGFERELYGGTEDVTQPWRFYLSHYYNLQKLGSSTQKRSWIKADYGFNPTRYWRLSYAVNYDLIGRELTAQNLSLYWSLHCWETSFTWYPTGFNSGFYFKINIKEIPQIKLEHRQGGLGL